MRRASLFVVTAVVGCSSPDPLLATCPHGVEQPLVNAAVVESYLGLSQAETRAVVRITNDTGPDAPLCSGAFVAPDWVVSAAHCLVIESPEVVVTADEGEPPVALRVVEAVAHPVLDVALLRVESAADGFGVLPLGLVAAGDRPLKPTDVVELAGYGRTEDGEVGELRFLVEPIVAVEAESLLVSGLGESGACDGDSGGPLLLRNGNGRVVVAGVLSSGAASCHERDRYVRLDALRSWLDETTGGLQTDDAPCGGIGREGRCLYDSALWCSGERVVAQACGEGRACGWDEGMQGFRCVARADDPCDGVDSVGACQDGAALRCDRGELALNACSCGQECRIDGKTGAPRCADLDQGGERR